MRAFPADVARGSRTVVTAVQVLDQGGAVVIDGLPIDGGTVTYDLGSDVGATAEVSVADPAYLPKQLTDPLAPFGNRLRISTGTATARVQVFDGPIVFCETPTERTSYRLQAESWLRWVMDDRFVRPWSPAAGAAVSATVTALISQSAPAATVVWAAGDAAVKAGLVWEESRWDAVKDLCASVGAVPVPVSDGSIRIIPEPMPDPAAAPVRTIDAGEDGVLLTGSQPALERAERFNGVHASNPDDPAIAYTATLASGPARWGGPFGRKVMYFSSPLLAAGTVRQAAETRLATLQGRSRVIGATMLPDPGIEAGDHVLVKWPADGREDLAMVRAVTIPLGPAEQTLDLRGTETAP
jgi:hypothetical protein